MLAQLTTQINHDAATGANISQGRLAAALGQQPDPTWTDAQRIGWIVATADLDGIDLGDDEAIGRLACVAGFGPADLATDDQMDGWRAEAEIATSTGESWDWEPAEEYPAGAEWQPSPDTVQMAIGGWR